MRGTSTRRDYIRWLVGATTTIAALAAGAPLAQAETVSFSSPGNSPFTVPARVTSIAVSAVGAAGGPVQPSSGCAGTSGGRGASVSATLSVTPAEQLVVGVGAVGGS